MLDRMPCVRVKGIGATYTKESVAQKPISGGNLGKNKNVRVYVATLNVIIQSRKTYVVVALNTSQTPVTIAAALQPTQVRRVDVVFFGAVAFPEHHADDHCAVASNLPAVVGFPSAAYGLPESINVFRRAQYKGGAGVEDRNR